MPVECLGLIGPDEMKKWKMKFDFDDTDSVSVSAHDGLRSAPMQTSDSGHPIINMMEFEVDPAAAFTVDRSHVSPQASQFGAEMCEDSESDSDVNDTFKGLSPAAIHLGAPRSI